MALFTEPWRASQAWAVRLRRALLGGSGRSQSGSSGNNYHRRGASQPTAGCHSARAQKQKLLTTNQPGNISHRPLSRHAVYSVLSIPINSNKNLFQFHLVKIYSTSKLSIPIPTPRLRKNSNPIRFNTVLFVLEIICAQSYFIRLD